MNQQQDNQQDSRGPVHHEELPALLTPGPFLKPLFVRGVRIFPNLVLAPMSGVTDLPFRTLVREINPLSVGLTVTEFISVEALTRENVKSLQMLAAHPEERPFSVQIFGYDIDRMIAAAQMVEQSGADIVDINSGCPVPKVVKKGGGCELMRQPQHLARMLEAVVKAVNIPVTLKVRAGWDSTCRNAVDIARLAEASGVAMLAVHGRTRAEAYRGASDWDYIGEVARAVSIPVCGSGDVVCAESLRTRVSAAPVAGVLIGRAALHNPWVFSEIVDELSGRTRVGRSAVEVPRVIRRYLELLREYLPERAILGRLKQIASQVTKLVRGASVVRRELCTSKSTEEFVSVLDRWEEALVKGLPMSFSDGGGVGRSEPSSLDDGSSDTAGEAVWGM